MNIIYIQSPNFSLENDPKWGRLDTSIIVIHATAGTDSLDWLTSTSSGVSSHYLISKVGTIYQLVKDGDVAWHAGLSSWNGKTNINRYSIGIELENLNTGKDPYPEAQIKAVVDLVVMLRLKYNIIANNVVAHYEISPGRKSDPKGFDMSLLRKPVSEYISDGLILKGLDVDPTILYKALNKYTTLSQQEKDSIICAYTAYGELTTIGNLHPFAQAVHETGWFASRRWVENRNPAGLGATNDGAEGYKADSIADGILRQYAHLLCYAVTDMQLNAMQKTIARLSPRRDKLIGSFGLGSAANRWLGLNGKWAYPGLNYGEKILEIGEMILQL